MPSFLVFKLMVFIDWRFFHIFFFLFFKILFFFFDIFLIFSLSFFSLFSFFFPQGLIPSLSPTQAALYQRYTNLFSSQKSYKNYRNAHAAAESPTVGYCGLLLRFSFSLFSFSFSSFHLRITSFFKNRDIVYMADSQPDYLDKGRRLINFAKLRSLYSRIQQDHMRNVFFFFFVFFLF